MHKPLVPHWQSVKRLLTYLKHTITFGLVFHRSSSTLLQAYSDADWASSCDDRRSTGGLYIFLGPKLNLMELSQASNSCSFKY
jgi:hypothetical protein